MMRLFIFLLLLVLFSCRQQKKPRQAGYIGTVTDTLAYKPDSLKNYTLASFLRKIARSSAHNYITIEDDETPRNWITQQDVDTLLSLIHSKQPCPCVVDPLSSHLPDDRANLGGYAILFLQQYRNNKPTRFNLYHCPRTNEEEAAELMEWWKKLKGIQ